MILDWLGKSVLGMARGWWLLILAAAIVAAVLVAQSFLARTVDTAREAGASQQQAADLTQTIERTETGNAARDEIRLDRGDARYDECLRTARTPANCQRFLPQFPADQR